MERPNTSLGLMLGDDTGLAAPLGDLFIAVADGGNDGNTANPSDLHRTLLAVSQRLLRARFGLNVFEAEQEAGLGLWLVAGQTDRLVDLRPRRFIGAEYTVVPVGIAQ